MEGALDEDVAPDQPKLNPPKKMKIGNFPWTETLNGKFAQAVLKRKGHLKTDMNQETKFNLVANDLVQMVDTPFFCSPLITGSNLKAKWNRIVSEFQTKFALTREGANLSGLAEASEYEKLVLSMLERKAGEEAEKDAESEKKKETQKKLLTHEANILQFQNRNTSMMNDTPTKVGFHRSHDHRFHQSVYLECD